MSSELTTILAIVGIIMGIIGPILGFFAGGWVKRTNKSIDDIFSKVNDSEVQIVEVKVKGELEKETQDKVEIEMKRSMSELASDMSIMAKNINRNHFSLKEHNLRIGNLEDQHKIISNELKEIAG